MSFVMAPAQLTSVSAADRERATSEGQFWSDRWQVGSTWVGTSGTEAYESPRATQSTRCRLSVLATAVPAGTRAAAAESSVAPTVSARPVRGVGRNFLKIRPSNGRLRSVDGLDRGPNRHTY
jgi:hypothetical protein